VRFQSACPKGALWEAYSKHYGKDADPVLLWQAATRDMNQTVPQSYIDQHMAEDAARASAEYGAQFRGDLERFVSREVVQAAVNVGVYERAYDHTLTYAGFVDPSGRSADSMTLAIAHFDYARQAVVLDRLRRANEFIDRHWLIGLPLAIGVSFGLGVAVGEAVGASLKTALFIGAGICIGMVVSARSERLPR